MGRLLRIAGLLSLLGFSQSAALAVSVSISPNPGAVLPGGQLQFTATVAGTSNDVVIWGLAGAGCSGIACGQISSQGLYTAPSTAPTPPIVIVTATSLADLSQSANARVYVGTALNVLVTVSPAAAGVVIGQQQQFSANVTGSSDTAVTWNLSGSGCSGAACGSISSNGVYTAPSTVPTPATVTVSATSVANPLHSGIAAITILAPVKISIAPTAAQVVTGQSQQFTATVVNTSNLEVNWSVSGSGCSGAACGAITSNGLYTAPAAVPAPPQVTVTATSLADPTKSSSATVTILSSIVVSISPQSARVAAGATVQFTATVAGSSNMSVSWGVMGSSCSGAACGTISATGLYTAPAAIPNPPSVTVVATSVADRSKSASAAVTIVAPVAVTISPKTASVSAGQTQQFTAAVAGTNNTGVSWGVRGAGCAASACGTITSSGLFTAPAIAPDPAQVTVTATSNADSTKSASAVVTIVPVVAVQVSPSTAKIVVSQSQQFTSAVSGTTNTAVTWSLNGVGCTGTACGTISSGGLYTAPATVPSSPQVTVTAISVADPAQSGVALVTILASVAVTISPKSAEVAVGTTEQFNASVAGTSNTAVSWNVSGSACGGSSCGTISQSGLYTAPASLPNPPQVTITATSLADSSRSATATVTIIHPLVLRLAPAAVVVALGGSQQFRAAVSGTTDNGVSWTASGPGCSGAACGTIAATGLYTAPATMPSAATIIITASSVADPSQTTSAEVALVASANARLSGRYVFLFKGVDSAGTYHAAGALTADGNGKLTAGVEDVNRTSGPSIAAPFTGVYSIGNEGHGQMTLTSSLGSRVFRFTLNALGTKASFIEFDSSGINGSGVLEQQSAGPFSANSVSGIYALQLSGNDSNGGRIGALGQLYCNAGFISIGSLDVNDAGAVPPTFGPFNGSFSLSSTGRGTVGLEIPGFGSGAFKFAAYLVSSSKFFLVSIDPLSAGNPLFSGPAELETIGNFSNSSIAGPAVFHLTGGNGAAPQDTIGRIGFDGVSTVAVDYDQNSNGTIAVGVPLTGAYDLGFTGRGTLNLDNNKGSNSVWYFYAISPSRAYLLDASSSFAGIGELDMQTVSPPFVNSDVLGTYAFAPLDASPRSTPLAAGSMDFDGTSTDGQGNVSGLENIAAPSSLRSNQAIAGTYSISTSMNDGRGTVTVKSPASSTLALWTIDDTDMIGMSITPGDAHPAILKFEQ